MILNEAGERVAIITSVKQAPNGQHLHIAQVEGNLNVGQTYQLQVDEARRRNIVKNHTATHLLHQALKDVLGDHANQAGSLVSANHLRFDFTHFGQVTADELTEMERIVNEKIWEAIPVETIETTVDKAKEMGATALFGEKYGKIVRVVKLNDYSVELCGGVHVQNSQDIGVFKILSEAGIGAGTRRIEAITGQAAYEWFHTKELELLEAASMLKTKQTKEVPEKIDALKQELKEAQSTVESLKAKIMQADAKDVFADVKTAGDWRYVTYQGKNQGMDDLRSLADDWRQKDISDVFVAASELDGKVNLLAAVQDGIVKTVKAGDLIKTIAPIVGGGGGGRPNLAQAGGKNPAGIPDALAEVATWLEKQGK